MSNLEKNIDNSAYEMTDDELFALSSLILDKNLEKYGVVDIEKETEETVEAITCFMKTLPLTSTAINSLVKLGINTREELEEENRVKYEKREWEQYL